VRGGLVLSGLCQLAGQGLDSPSRVSSISQEGGVPLHAAQLGPSFRIVCEASGRHAQRAVSVVCLGWGVQ
jgi:hypothetical protein